MPVEWEHVDAEALRQQHHLQVLQIPAESAVQLCGEPSDLYVPKGATGKVWDACQMSRTDPTRAWCKVCNIWLPWRNTTDVLTEHCTNWHETSSTGVSVRRIRSRQDEDLPMFNHPSPPAAFSMDPMAMGKPRTLNRAGDLPSDPNATAPQSRTASQSQMAVPVPASVLPVACHPFARETVEFLVQDLLPPAVLDGEGFRSFTSALTAAGRGPEYVPISRLALLHELEARHTRISHLVAEMLVNSGDGIALSVEVWHRCSYATVYAHTLHATTFEPLCAALLVHHFKEELPSGPSSIGSLRIDEPVPSPRVASDGREVSTGSDRVVHSPAATGTSPFVPGGSHDETSVEGRIVVAVCETIRAWKIPPSRIVAVTTSSEELSTSRMERFSGVKSHFTCVGVLLTRVISKVLEQYMASIDQACRTFGLELASSFANDWVLQSRLVQQISVGFNDKHIGTQSKDFSHLSDPELAPVLSLNDLLQPVADAADLFSNSEERLPLSMARAVLENLLEVSTNVSIGHEIDRQVRSTALEVAQSFSDALSILNADHGDIGLLCLILDPRFKDSLSSSLLTKQLVGQTEASGLLRRHYEAELNRMESFPPDIRVQAYQKDVLDGSGFTSEVQTRDQAEPAPEERRRTGLAAGSTWRSAPQIELARGVSLARGDEVDMFLSEECISPPALVAPWWAARRTKYPVLARIAARVLAVPATASPTARAFRRTFAQPPKRDVVVAMRRRGLCELSDVSPAYVQTVVFLNSNLHILARDSNENG
jgi:hAT family C-terminal dimerisation region